MNRYGNATLFGLIVVAFLTNGCGNNRQDTSNAQPDPNVSRRKIESSSGPSTLEPDGGDARGGIQLPREEIDKQNAFVVNKQFAINTPGGGYTWNRMRTMQAQGVSVRIYGCTKEGSTASITLTVEGREANVEPARSAAIKGHYNGTLIALRNGGFSDLRGQPPSLESPIPGRVYYSVFGTKPTGESVYIHGITAFGENVYSLKGIANTREEADQLLKVIYSFTELPKP